MINIFSQKNDKHIAGNLLNIICLFDYTIIKEKSEAHEPNQRFSKENTCIKRSHPDQSVTSNKTKKLTNET